MKFQSESSDAVTREELRDLLFQAADDPGSANNFWDRFSYKVDLFSGNYSRAKDGLIYLLHQCQSIDPEVYSRIHKGTPYYWLGSAAYLQNDYQTATFFFDAAVSEDLRIGAHPVDNPTPATFFLTLAGEQPQQAAQELVQATQKKVQRMLDFYNPLEGKPEGLPILTIESLRDKFLISALLPGNQGLRTLATTFISFFIEWDYRNEFFDIRPGNGTTEPFFLHLFKGCVLFESLLKANDVNKPRVGATLGPVLISLCKELGISSDLRIGGITLPEIVADLTNADNQIETAILFTGKVRNTTGHNLGWEVNMNKIQYQQLFSMIAASCLHAIACLYRTDSEER